MCFSRKLQILVTFFAKNAKINALEANIGSFQEISVKYLSFPHPGISFMTKELRFTAISI